MKLSKTQLFTAFFLLISTGFSSTILADYWKSEAYKASLKLDKQSFCLDLDGDIIGENIDLKIKPASVTKLYTTLWSLERLGKDHRFETKFSVKGNDLYIHGGSDPYFVTENILVALDKLSDLGYSKFNYVYFDKNLFYNWKKNSSSVSKSLKKIFNKKNWTQKTAQTINEMNLFFKRNASEIKIDIKNISAKYIVPTKTININEDYSFTLSSSPLWMHLKQVNMYSNNFYTDEIFNFLGGEKEFNTYINRKLNATDDEIYFYTGSGLGDNYTTCRITLTMLDELEILLSNLNLQKQDIMAVPGVDQGTMKKRFTSLKYARKIVAKTGTLNDTSAFSGFFLNKNIKFAVFNHTKAYANKTRVRKLQDDIIKKAIDLEEEVLASLYESPDYISIKDILIQ
mgnify:CR=1 FL=1